MQWNMQTIALVIAVIWAIDKLLAANPSIAANSTFQLATSILKAITDVLNSGTQPPATTSAAQPPKA